MSSKSGPKDSDRQRTFLLQNTPQTAGLSSVVIYNGQHFALRTKHTNSQTHSLNKDFNMLIVWIDWTHQYNNTYVKAWTLIIVFHC